MKKLVLLLALGGFTNLMVKAVDLSEAQAMYVYNIARMVQWPGVNIGEFVIGVYGNSGFKNAFDQYSSTKKIYGQNIKVEPYNSPESITNCNILFVSFSKSKDLDLIIKSCAGKNILIITEKQGLVDNGAAISFILKDDKLRYEFNEENTKKYGLQVSSQLIEMAVN